MTFFVVMIPLAVIITIICIFGANHPDKNAKWEGDFFTKPGWSPKKK